MLDLFLVLNFLAKIFCSFKIVLIKKSVIYKNARCVDALDAKKIESNPLNFKIKVKKVLNILKRKKA